MSEPEPTLAGGGHARLSAEIELRLREHAHLPLAILSDGPLGRHEVLRESERLATRLRAADVGPGDRVATFLQDERQLILLVIAALRAGVAFVVGDGRATQEEVADLVTVCRPKAVLTDATFTAGGGLERLAPSCRVLRLTDPVGSPTRTASTEPPVQRAAPDTALLMFTSGTTSSSKAVELTYGNLLAQLRIFEEAYGFAPGDRLLNLLPLHHTDGLTRGPLAALWFGATVVRPFSFSLQAVPDLLALIPEDRITHLVAVPAILRIVDHVGRSHPDAFRTPEFRYVISSADHLDPALWTRFEETFGVPVANAYGLSEAVCDSLFAGPDDRSRVPGTIGRPIGVSAEVVDDAGSPVAEGGIGELVLRGPTVMRGYFAAPALTAEVLSDGALRTGDLVRRRADGLVEFVGRRKTAIVSAGVTIHPEGVTAVLAGMRGVMEAFAFGVPDPDRGERLVAAVVPVRGASLTETQVWDHCRGRLSPERTPAEIRIVEALPRGPSGKVIVGELSEVHPAASPGSRQTVLGVAARCLRLPPDALSRESTPFNTPGWDSLAHLALIMEIEDAFGIMFSASDIVEFGSLGDAEDIVERTLRG